MTHEEALDRLARVAAVHGDPEVAHYEEDVFHHDVLVAIAKGETDDPASLASVALLTTEAVTTRWYA